MSLRTDERNRIVTIGVLATLSACGAWALGVPVAHSLLIAAAFLALGFVLPAQPVEPDQRPATPSSPRRAGTRRELMRLSWSYGRGSKGAGQVAVDRLAATAIRRLHHLGIDVDDPDRRDAAEKALGTFAYSVLIAGTIQAPIRHRDMAHCLTAVEQLNTDARPLAVTRRRATAAQQSAATHQSPTSGMTR